MKATDYIARFLEAQGVHHIFEMSGGMITHLLDSIAQQSNIKIVSVHHEQTAAFAADAYGRLTGVPGVALATSGPGATNLLTGIGSCHFDSSPAVFITGQVNRAEQKGDRAIRQLGFQETDIVAMARPITKAAWQVQNPDDLPQMLVDAFRLATEGRPGPVLLDIPMDVQRTNIEVPDVIPHALSPHTDPVEVSPQALEELFGQMASAKRPLILVGGGIRSAQAVDLLRQFVETVRVPVVNSIMAVDVLGHDDPLRVGMIGSYGNRWANLAIGEADFLLVLGSRLDVRQTGSETRAFKGDRVIFHVDTEPGEVNNRVVDCVPVIAHLHGFLQSALAFTQGRAFPDRAAWLAEIDALRTQWPDTGELTVAGINPNAFMHQLSAAFPDARSYVSDVGQHQMWSAQSLDIAADQRFLNSGGMGSMGFALPAAIGAAFGANDNRPVIVIAGDGGFQTNIQELQTIVRNKLPVKVVVMNNGCHGMVRQFQTSYFDGRLQSTLWGYSAPDFAEVALAYRVPGRRIGSPDEVADALAWFAATDGPALLEVMIDTYADALPKIAFGRPMTEMEPFAKPLEMEGT